MTKNKLGALALAFAIALGFWMYVVAYVSTEYSKTLYNIPVALEGKGMLTDRQLMLLSDEDYLVDIKVTGSRQDVSKIDSGNIQVVADLSGISEAGEYKLTYSVIYPGDVPSGSVSSQKDPDRVTVVVASKRTKEIPVRVRYDGDVPADYIKDTSSWITASWRSPVPSRWWSALTMPPSPSTAKDAPIPSMKVTAMNCRMRTMSLWTPGGSPPMCLR